MSWALEALDLPADADERAIKRAYAARLKVTRPDDDPAGFQQLHETYQAALAWARHRASLAVVDGQDEDESEHGDDPGSVTGNWSVVLDADTATHSAQELQPTHAQVDMSPERAPSWRDDDDTGDADASSGHDTPPQRPASQRAPSSPQPPPSIEVPVVDIAQMQLRILHQARELAPEQLQHWLVAQPELWSLEHKPRIGARLQQHLLEHGDALNAHSYDVLATFFDWEQALDAPDPYFVERARSAMHRRWLLHPSGHQELANVLRAQGDGNATVTQVRRLLALLRRGPSEGMQFLAMLWPGRPTKVRRLLDVIGYVPGATRAPEPIDRERANGWYLAAEREAFNPVAALVGLARSAIVALTFLLLCLLLAMIDNNPSPGISPVLKVGLYGAGVIFGGWCAWYGFTCLLRWQARPERDPRLVSPQLQRYFIPAVGALAALLVALDHKPVAAGIALPLLVIALARWMRRAGRQFSFRWGWWGWAWFLFLGLKALAVAIGFLILVPQLALAATGIAWLSDFIAQWKVRRTAAEA